MTETSPFKLCRHFIFFAIAFALIVIGCFVLMESMVLIMYAGIMIYSVLGVTVVHFASQSVLGAGGLIKRTLVSLAISMIVLLALTAGMGYLLFQNQADDFWFFARMLCVMAPPFLVAAQIPFWLLRGVLGWQFVQSNQPPVSLRLKELFLVTAVFGIAFAMPAVAEKLVVEVATDLQVGGVHYVVEVQPDGSSVLVEKQVTQENIKQLQADEIRQSRSSVAFGMMIYAAGFAVASLLSIPILWCVFRFKKRKAIVSLAIYALALFLFWFSGFTVFYGFNFTLNQWSLTTAFSVVLSIGLFAWPSFVSRSKGIELSTRRVRSVESEPSESIVDPLA